VHAQLYQEVDMKSAITKDYHWIKFTETRQWNKDFLESIGTDAVILSTYVFDHNSITNCCELTPSYELHLAGAEFKTSREMTDAEREEIEEKIRAAQANENEVKYIHCKSIDEGHQCSRPIRQFEDCDDDVTIEDVIEYYQANPW
jgi:hypothetical protein